MATLPIDKKFTVSITPVDALGNPAKVDGVPVWSEGLGTLVLTPAPDGMSCEVRAASLGSTQIKVEADADLGEGVRTITGLLDVETVAAEAVAFAINVGPLEPA